MAQPGAQFCSLPLRIESCQDDQCAHQPDSQSERGQPQFYAEFHNRLPSNLAQVRKGWPQEPAGAGRIRPLTDRTCCMHEPCLGVASSTRNLRRLLKSCPGLVSPKSVGFRCAQIGLPLSQQPLTKGRGSLQTGIAAKQGKPFTPSGELSNLLRLKERSDPCAVGMLHAPVRRSVGASAES